MISLQYAVLRSQCQQGVLDLLPLVGATRPILCDVLLAALEVDSSAWWNDVRFERFAHADRIALQQAAEGKGTMATRSALEVHRHRTTHHVRLLGSAAGEFFRAAGTSLSQFAVGGRTRIVLAGTDTTAGRIPAHYCSALYAAVASTGAHRC